MTSDSVLFEDGAAIGLYTRQALQESFAIRHQRPVLFPSPPAEHGAQQRTGGCEDPGGHEYIVTSTRVSDFSHQRRASDKLILLCRRLTCRSFRGGLVRL